jgi:hypothetical protein
MDKDDPFDLEKFRLRPEDIAAYVGKADAAAPARRQDRFVIVPMAWSDRLKGARHVNTYKLAVYLLYQYWRTGKPIALTNVALVGTGVPNPRSKWRALCDLERLGLVEIKRRTRKTPHVTLLKTRTLKGGHHD